MAVMTYDIDDERRDIDVSREISRLIPDASPFAAILMRAKKKVTDTTEFKWWEYEPGGWWTQVNAAGGYLADATDIVVDDETIFSPKSIVKNARTGEVMYVSAITAATHTLTVVRSYGTTDAAAMNDNDWLVRLGNAMEENSSVPERRLKQPTKLANITQIFRTPFDQSMSSEAERLKTNETERARLRRDKALEHRLDIERAFLFGELNDDSTNKRRMTKGLLSFITTNVTDAGGALTEAELETFCESIFTYGSKKKLLVCAPKVGSVINQIATSKIETRSGEDTYGIRMKTYKSFHGDLYIVTSQVFEHDYNTYGIAVDMDYIAYRPLNGRDTHLRTNIQAPDLDGWMDEYLTEAGLEVRLEKCHGVLSNVTSKG